MNNKKLCSSCNKRKAQIDSVFGVILCRTCQLESEKKGVEKPLEFTSESIKNQRKEYQRSMLQPFYRGVLSKEFIEENGTSKLAGITEKDIKESKYVYQDLPRWHKRGESKR